MSTLEWALLTPVLILVILGTIQFALVYHARQVALAAAQTGAREARTNTGNAWKQDARKVALAAVTGVGGPGLLTGATVTFPSPKGQGDLDNRWVVVRGKAPSILPGIHLTISERAGGPVECFRPDAPDTVECR